MHYDFVSVMKIRRSHMKYIAVAGLVLFFSVLLLLFSRISSHSQEHAKDVMHVKTLSVQEVYADDDNETLVSSRGLRAQRPPDSAPRVIEGHWIVLKEDGVDVYSDLLLSSSITQVLPFGAIVVGQQVSLDRSNKEDGARSTLTLKVVHPVQGYVALRSSSQSPFQLKLLRIDPKPVIAIVPSASAFEPPVNLCSNSSFINIDADFRGGDLTNTPNPVDLAAPSDCCELCYSISDCSLWTFTDSKQCWLKSDGARLIKMKPKPVPPGVNAAAVVPTSTGFICGRSKPDSGMSGAAIPPDIMTAHLDALNKLELCPKDVSPVDSTVNDESLLKTLVGSNPTTAHASIVMSLGDVNARLSDPVNPFLLRAAHRTSGDWREQHLIGTGSVGLMVGGTLHYEIAPVSVAGLFTKKAARPPPNAKKAPPSPVTASFNGSVFQQARTAFLAGQYVNAEDLINSHIDKTLGMFEYVMDLTSVFSPVPIVQKATEGAKLAPANKAVPVKPKPRPSLRNNFGIGRNSLLRRIESVVEYRVKSNVSVTTKPKFGSVVYTDHSLDLKQGVSRSFFLELADKSSGGKVAHLHMREWFASAVDDVAVHAASCHSSQGKKKGCLHVVQMLSRDFNNRAAPTMRFNLETAKLTDSVALKWSKRSEKKVIGYQYSVELSSSSDVSLPTSVACGAALCIGVADGKKMSSFTIGGASSEPSLVCNHVEQLYHITTVVSGTPNSPVNKIASECMNRINNALKKGIDDLRAGHTQFTSTHMTNTEVEFRSELAHNTRMCATHETLSRLCQFSNNPAADSHLLSQLYQYGRFLALSSSTQAVPNLQGVWADGVMAAWNGDYHLNINLQMMYWGMEGAGLGEMTIQPLRRFIQQMRIKGRDTAVNMYGAKNPDSWVGHGFTDSEMSMLIQAGAEWSLCVTCGAWVSLQLWEHIIHNSLDKKMQQEVLTKELLPTLKGVIAFFMEYAYIERRDDGNEYVVHTGPTTSPENSYAIVLNEGAAEVQAVPLVINLPNPRMKNKPPPPPPKQNRVNFLTMSPAIDISLLRQVANAFTLSLKWLERLPGFDVAAYPDKKTDEKLAAKFQEFVAHMPNKGMPSTMVVTASTDVAALSGLPFRDTAASAVTVIEEYPSPLPGLSYKSIDMVDKGHRHFSVLHWLYPNTFLPLMNSSSSSSSNGVVSNLLSAAKETMRSKRDNGGGHTGWSAVWEACLYGRLGMGEELLESVKHLVGRYLTSNMLTLHPPLGKVDPSNCGTCFREMDGLNPSGSDPHMVQRMAFIQTYLMDQLKSLGPGANAVERLRAVDVDKLKGAFQESILKSLSEDHSAEWLNNNRGLVTARDDKFQLDANLGFMAAVHEMLAHSHIPGTVQLLPALPASLSVSGLVRGLHLRGNVKVWFEWTQGRVTVGKMMFNSDHPWLSGVQELVPGFYSAAETDKDGLSVSLVTPNELRVFLCRNNQCSAKAIDSWQGDKCLQSSSGLLSSYDSIKSSKRTVHLSRKCIPLSVYFCDAHLKTSECVTKMEDLLIHSRGVHV